MITSDKLAQAFAIGAAPATDEYRFGTVASTDGGVYVKMADTDNLTRCTSLTSVSVGERVQVCIKANGSCVIVGKIGKAVTYPDYYKPYEEPGGYYELYSNASGTEGTVHLNDAVINYKFIDIFARKEEAGAGFISRKVKVSDLAASRNVLLFFVHNPGNNVLQVNSKLVIVNDSDITVDASRIFGLNIGNGSFSTFAGENLLKITNVIGYK